MSKVCFVISPLGPDDSATRKRADYVLNAYIAPACERAGYDPVRGDCGTGRDIVEGTTTALKNAPMAVAYMGPAPNSVPASGESAGCWNANVMIEIGYRLASRLPLIFLCDQDSQGNVPDLPLNLQTLRVIGLPRPDPSDRKWVDPQPQKIVDRLIRQFRDEEQEGRILDSMHPVAAINAANAQLTTPNSLYYTAASDAADDVFGVQSGDGRGPRLVGCTMEQFLASTAKRMHPNQWEAFKRDQQSARSKLKLRAHGEDDKQSTAKVPIVFENHENDDYNHRAFLPIIVEDFRPQDRRSSWYNLRVLYLNVTTATEKVAGEDGQEFYVCRLDPTSDRRLEPLKARDPAIRVFLSYGSSNRANVKDVFNRLLAMGPVVEPFMDVSISAGDNWVKVLRETMETSELCFLFLDGDAMGDGQKAEVDVLEARLMARKDEDYPVVPVLLRSNQPARLPAFLGTRQWAKFEDLTDTELRQILWSHFPKRCPGDWKSRPGGWGKRPGDWGNVGDSGKVRSIETPVQPAPVQPPPVQLAPVQPPPLQSPPVERRRPAMGED
jgi:hypothetical protein